MSEILASTTLDTINCGGCGIVYAVPQAWRLQKSRDHTGWSCPNGCRRAYTVQSDIERAEAAAKRAQELLDIERSCNKNLRCEKERAERRLSAAHGQITKISNRVKHGVCPCCKRTFKQLAAHMKDKHPDYAEPKP